MSVCVSQMWIWRPRGAEAAAAAAAAASSYILEHSPCPPVQIPSHSRGLRRIHLEDSSAGPAEAMRRPVLLLSCSCSRFSCSRCFLLSALLASSYFGVSSSFWLPLFLLHSSSCFVVLSSFCRSLFLLLSCFIFLFRRFFCVLSFSLLVCVIFFFCRFLFMFSLLTDFSSPFPLTDGGESGSSVTYFIHNCLFINFFIVYHLSRYYFTNVFTL